MLRGTWLSNIPSIGQDEDRRRRTKLSTAESENPIHKKWEKSSKDPKEVLIWTSSWSIYCSLKPQWKGGCQEAILSEGKQGDKTEVWKLHKNLSDGVLNPNHHQYVCWRSGKRYNTVYSVMVWDTFQSVVLKIFLKVMNYKHITEPPEFDPTCNTNWKTFYLKMNTVNHGLASPP